MLPQGATEVNRETTCRKICINLSTVSLLLWYLPQPVLSLSRMCIKIFSLWTSLLLLLCTLFLVCQLPSFVKMSVLGVQSQFRGNAGWRQLFQGIFTDESSWEKLLVFDDDWERWGGWIQVALSCFVFLAWSWSFLLVLRGRIFSEYTLAISTGSRVCDLDRESISRGLFLFISKPHLPDRTSELGGKKHLHPGTCPGTSIWSSLYYF